MSCFKSTMSGIVFALALTLACSRPSNAPTSPSTHGAADTAATPDDSTLKAPPPAAVSPINDQPAKNFPVLTARPTAMNFDGHTATLQYHFELFNENGVEILDSGLLDSPIFPITTPLESKKRHSWRVRAETRGRFTAWSQTASFMSFETGHLVGDEVYDPLYDGVTVGERVGPTSFVPEQGLRLDSNLSYVRYAIPTTITSGEFSVEVMGLQADASGEKSKVFGMSTNSNDFITDPYRFDVQYRGIGGEPSNSITFRMLYGSAEDTAFRYEPSSAQRSRSVVRLNPETVYFWKATWGTEIRIILKEGIAGRTLYDLAMPAKDGKYDPMPHYAYLGTPTGRSGAESASIPGTIFRNVWISSRPRPPL